MPLAQYYITTASCRITSNNPDGQVPEEVGSRRRGERSESMTQSFLYFFGCCSLFSCSRTTVTATWNARGWPRLAASTKLSQAAFRLPYLSETSGAKESRLGARNPDVSAKSRRGQKHLPPTSASRAMRRSRSAWQRAVMSLRPCSRCRTRRHS